MHALVAKTTTTSTVKNLASEVAIEREWEIAILSGAATTSADQDVTHRLRGISAL